MRDRVRRTSGQLISISVPTVPSGGMFGEANAANPSALTFTARAEGESIEAVIGRLKARIG